MTDEISGDRGKLIRSSFVYIYICMEYVVTNERFIIIIKIEETNMLWSHSMLVSFILIIPHKSGIRSWAHGLMGEEEEF